MTIDTNGFDTDCGSPNDRLMMKVVEVIKGELGKSTTQKKLKDAIDPLLRHVGKVVQPYVILFIVLLLSILVCQLHLVHRFYKLSKKTMDA